ncbi:hypothetical protein QBK99_05275 [Corticibacterium sp. UT-5YL-CI-8]|nr:hypothetical protein [Tianweitania sp. UT-5YL-CI-8]
MSRYRSLDSAPRDGTPIIGRNLDRAEALVRWRIYPDLERGESPYWALFSSDEAFNPIEWRPSDLTTDEIMKRYG